MNTPERPSFKAKRRRKPASPRLLARGIRPNFPDEDFADDETAPNMGTMSAQSEITSEPKTIALLQQDIIWDKGDATGIDGLQGAELISALTKKLPAKPGVYRMFNAVGDVLYVGKAKNLKNRVTNYTRLGGHTNRIASMIGLTVAMEFVVTRTETEALLLEANLIKRLRPRFNVLMRDDKSFPYILLTKEHRAPGIFKHRGARGKGGAYFGPFASAGAVTRTINALQRAFLLRTCTDSVYDARTRPCLLYQIKRCSGPCTGEISEPDYAELVMESQDFLSGKSGKVKKLLADNMVSASDDLDFERAALYRDRLTALSHVQSHQGINPTNVDEADVFAIHCEAGQTCIEVFFFRTGQNWGNRAYFPRADSALEPGEILAAFLSQFYDDKPIPKLILVNEDFEERALLSAALSERADRKIEVLVPSRGEKRDLVSHVASNAREALGRRIAENATQRSLLKSLQKTFELQRMPRRIETYDNSHIMGTNAVGGMIVAGPEGFAKAHYRKFNIKSETITPGDDFGMMQEVLERRFKRLLKEEIDDEINIENNAIAAEEEDEIADQSVMPEWPDIILIDGGIGQFNAAKSVLTDLGILDRVTVIGIAKGIDREAGRERFFIDGKIPFTLPPRDPVLYFVQRMRDEAHRFAIGTHRAKRKKEMIKNPLDEIDGIGPSRKRALLSHFGTAKEVARSAKSDLMKVDGISESMAQLIYDHFHGG